MIFLRGMENMKLRRLIKGFLTINLFLMCIGCQDKSKNIIVNNEDQETINLRFYGYKSEAINVVAIEDSLQDYMKENPHIKITYESVKGIEYYNVLEKRLKSGHYDDIFMIDEDHFTRIKK